MQLMLYNNKIILTHCWRSLFFSICFCASSPVLLAHPHSFIDINMTVMTEKQKLVGLKMVWIMDEMTSADLLYDIGNAKDDAEIWKKLAAEVMANVLNQHYFTEIYRDSRPIKYLNLPTAYNLSRKGFRAVLEFVLPLAEAQPLIGKPFIISTYDPSYFVDMSYESQQSLNLPNELKKNCQLSLFTPNPDPALQNYALSLDKNDSPDEDRELGQQFAQQVTLQCH